MENLKLCDKMIIIWYIALELTLYQMRSGWSGWHAEECCEENFENSKSGRGYYEDCLQAGMLASN